MKNIYSLSARFMTIMLLFIQGCTTFDSDLEIVKNYEPENEYFKAGLKSLHFIIETDTPDSVDSTLSQFFTRHNIPTNGSGLQDGIYTATSPYDAYDFRHEIIIEIKNERIVSVNYNEISMDGTSKRLDPKYNEKMGRAGIEPRKAYPILEADLLSTQNLSKVDAVTGATYSTFRFKYVLGLALMKAKLNTTNK